MTMDLKSFFDLDKVVFTKLELELPYEDSHPKVNTSTPLPKHSREKFEK